MAFSGNQFRAQSWRKIAFVRQDGDFETVRRPYRRKTCISALGEHHIGRLFFQNIQSRTFCGDKSKRNCKIFRRKRTDKFWTIDKKIGTSKGCDKSAFNAVSSHIRDGIPVFEFLHKGKIGNDVSCAPAACKENTFHENSICPCPIFIDGTGRGERRKK